jgi:rhomboid family GlyGly-CTERM serine protease
MYAADHCAATKPCFTFPGMTLNLQRAILALGKGALTLSLAIAVLLIFATDSAAMFEFSRGRLAAGQWWRVLTGHLTHWSADHLGWDLMMFVVLGVVLERQSRARFVALLLGSAAAISAAVFWIQPEFELYRGLSGVDSGLFVAVCVGMLAEARRDRERTTAFVAAGLLLAFVAKTVFEYATGTTLFVECAAAGFTPLALSHLAGAMVGLWPLANMQSCHSGSRVAARM